MVRASFRLWAGIAFWGILISAFVINDGVWPLKGFWPPALCAFAIGALAILFVGISYWSPLRSLVFLPDTDVTEYLAKIKPGMMIAILLSLIFAVRAFVEFNG